jgi:hypothetical protein
MPVPDDTRVTPTVSLPGKGVAGEEKDEDDRQIAEPRGNHLPDGGGEKGRKPGHELVPVHGVSEVRLLIHALVGRLFSRARAGE